MISIYRGSLLQFFEKEILAKPARPINSQKTRISASNISKCKSSEDAAAIGCVLRVRLSGAPISHLINVLNDANEMLQELGVRLESSANEAAAAASRPDVDASPRRGACTFKAPVGSNVASDALANLSSGGVKGGALIIVGEDYGEGSSIMDSLRCRR